MRSQILLLRTLARCQNVVPHACSPTDWMKCSSGSFHNNISNTLESIVEDFCQICLHWLTNPAVNQSTLPCTVWSLSTAHTGQRQHLSPVETTWNECPLQCVYVCVCMQLALHPSTWPPPAPARTGASSWPSPILQTAAVTTCVRPTTAAAPTSTSSASGQVPGPNFWFLSVWPFTLKVPSVLVLVSSRAKPTEKRTGIDRNNSQAPGSAPDGVSQVREAK